LVGNKILGPDYISAECKVYRAPNGYIAMYRNGDIIPKDMKLYTKEYLSIINSRFKNETIEKGLMMYRPKNTDNIIKNVGRKPIEIKDDQGQTIKVTNTSLTTEYNLNQFNDKLALSKVIPVGSFIRLANDADVYIVEKKFEVNNGTKLLITQYGFGEYSDRNISIKDLNLQSVKYHSKIINENLEEAVNLFIPN